MKYALKYNAFHNLESIGIDGKAESLIKYTYKNGDGRLKEMTYANGDKMSATYNSVGQLVAEKWFNKDNALVAHYKYVYDNSGNIVRSIDIMAKKEYNYIYTEGTLIEAITYSIELNGENIVGKTVTDNIRYVYDSEGNMTKKIITSKDGESFIYNYETSDDKTVVKFDAVNDKVSSHSKSDSFGRKIFDELQLGSGFISRQFEYVMGTSTEEHTKSGKLKSSPTTQLVSRILLSDGRTIEYEYDAEERITKVIDSVDGTTEYTYDALGQLLTERLNGHIINSMTYDTYGNIVSKNGQTYFYDSTWHDLLTGIESESIEYDAQGNPTKYLGHTLTWEKGRQLKSFDGNTYTYNANGIRTSKTVNGVTHTYTLDGTKILKETWGENTLIPLYDNEDSVCGIIYNDYAYYFLKNLQGDVIAITNNKGKVVASYTYDAWGVCTIVSDNTGIIARVNPFRYRGYYFDQEIGLYYLQSRYYDPVIGRYANADSIDLIPYARNSINTNIFAYCSNDGINNIDSTGYISFKDIWGLIKNSFDFIHSILEQVKNSFYSTPTASQIKKLAKQEGKSQRQIIKELKKNAKESEKCLKWFNKAAKIAKIISVVLFAIYLIQFGKNVFYDIYELLVEIFVEVAGYVIGEIVAAVLKLVPYAGIILGVVGSWAIGIAISCFFTTKRKKKMTKAYASKMKNSTRWYDWVLGLFTSIAATF